MSFLDGLLLLLEFVIGGTGENDKEKTKNGKTNQ